jgi:hypothetical protein
LGGGDVLENKADPSQAKRSLPSLWIYESLRRLAERHLLLLFYNKANYCISNSEVTFAWSPHTYSKATYTEALTTEKMEFLRS